MWLDVIWPECYGWEVVSLPNQISIVSWSFVQEHLIRDDQKLILLASLSDSLEYVADSIER